MIALLTVIKTWWREKVYPMVDEWCDAHTKFLLAMEGFLLFLVFLFSWVTWYNMKTAREYLEKLNLAQEIVSHQKDTISSLTESLEKQLGEMEELKLSLGRREEVHERVEEILSLSILSGQSSLHDIQMSREMYNKLVEGMYDE